MNVICVDNKKDGPDGMDAPELNVGVFYEVSHSLVIPILNRPIYLLKGMGAIYFDSLYFSPCTGPDEKALLKSRIRERRERLWNMVVDLIKRNPLNLSSIEK